MRNIYCLKTNLVVSARYSCAHIIISIPYGILRVFFTYIQNQYRVRFKALRIDKEPHISTAQLVTYLNKLRVDYEEVPTATLT